MTYVKDLTERCPDMGEPEEEREYLISAWVPMMVETRVYATNEDEAEKEAIEKLKRRKASYKIVDKDFSETEFIEVEEI